MNVKQALLNLKSKDKTIREKAVDELAFLGEPSTVVALKEILLNDPEKSVRRRAALALGRINSDESCDALYRAITMDKDEETRRNASIALGKFFDERAILPLYEIYSTPKKSNFFENIDRARVNLVLTEFAQYKGFPAIEDLVEWKKSKKNDS